MKKLVLLLGALSLVSSVAYAKEVVPAVEEVVVVEEVAPVTAPTLTVSSIGQYIEIDNTSGGADVGEDVFFANFVNFAYGDDWTFGLLAAKRWSIDTDDGIHGVNHRIQLDAWRHFDNFSIGARYRSQETYDRYYLRTKYSYGMFSGWIDVAYQSNNSDFDHEDSWYSEAEPIMVTLGPVTVGYYWEWDRMQNELGEHTGDNAGKSYYKGSLNQELRVKVPLYVGEKLSLGAEYRWSFDYDEDYGHNAKHYDNTAHKVVLNAAYAFTDNFTVDGYYRYDMRDWDAQNGADTKGEDSNKYYGEFYVGWTYTF